MDRNRQSFKDRFKRWRNGESYWDIVGRPLGDDKETYSELSEDEAKALNDRVNGIVYEYASGKDNIKDSISNFVSTMGPPLYKEVVAQKFHKPELVFNNLMHQMDYESVHGTSRLAKEQNNYSGFGHINGKYRKYKTREDFLKDYVSYYRRNAKRTSAAQSKTPYDFGMAVGNLGYYTADKKQYSTGLANMYSLRRYIAKHRKDFPDLYQLKRPNSKFVQQLEQTQERQQYPFTYPVNIPRPYFYDNSVPSTISGATTDEKQYTPAIPQLPNILDVWMNMQYGNTPLNFK